MHKKNENGTNFKKSDAEPLFALVKDQQTNKVQIVIGNFVVSSQKFDTFKQAEDYIKSKPYELLINTSILFMKFENDEKDVQKNAENAAGN